MKRIARLAMSLGVLNATLLAAAAIASGCGGDDTATPADGSTDGTTGEGGADALPDVLPDVAVDVARDVAPDVVDSGTDANEAGFDASVIGAFPSATIQAYCQRLQACCNIGTSSFDMTHCIGRYEYIGGFDALGLSGNRLRTAIGDGGNINYDPAKAMQCLADIAALPCGSVSTAQVQTLRNDCFDALQGRLAVGTAGCQNSIECARPGYCAVPDGGTTGTCASLIDAGGPCTFNEECTYRGSGAPPNFCNIWVNAQGNPDPTAGGSNTCVPSVGLDAGCGYTLDYPQECLSLICNPNTATCTSSFPLTDPGVPNGTCDSLTIHDAGGGG